MKFLRTPQFKDDFNCLGDVEKQNVVDAFPRVAQALEGDVDLYRHFRIKKMQGWTNIWEGHVKGDNLCFTFHFDRTDTGAKVCFFRRVGTHDIYKKP